MSLQRARRIADRAKSALADVTERRYVVGSVRRGEADVGDVELLVEPRMQRDLFGGGDAPRADVAPVEEALRDWAARWIKGGARMMQVETSEGVHVEVYLCYPPAEWGTLMAIRTGPAELGRRTVTRIRRRGWRVKYGAVWSPTRAGPDEGDPGRVVRRLEGEDGWWLKRRTPTELEFFRAARLQLVPPSERDGDVPEWRPGT